MKYMLISVDDARWLARRAYDATASGSHRHDLVSRLETDEGGDFEEIVAMLKKCEPCAAGVIEGVGCGASHEAQRLGRRLDRLLERAQPGGRGHRLPNPPKGGTV